MEQALEQAAAHAVQRADALPAASPSTSAPSWQGSLEQARARLDGLTGQVAQAAEQVAAVDTALGAGEDALRNWLAASEAARRKLANWTSRAVG
jgi:hypothetical protein